MSLFTLLEVCLGEQALCHLKKHYTMQFCDANSREEQMFIYPLPLDLMQQFLMQDFSLETKCWAQAQDPERLTCVCTPDHCFHGLRKVIP